MAVGDVRTTQGSRASLLAAAIASSAAQFIAVTARGADPATLDRLLPPPRQQPAEPARGVSAGRLNIVFILDDDLGPDAVACYGGGAYSNCTPRLDGLAAKGLRFTHCYASATCTPFVAPAAPRDALHSRA